MTKQLIVMGKDNMNNSLLASYIEKNTSFPCYILDLSQKDSHYKDVVELANLLLIDCNHCDDQQVEALLERCSSVFSDDCHIALFNTTDKNNTEQFAQHILIKGIFSEDVSHLQLISGIKSIFNGELWLSRKLLSTLAIQNRKNSPSHQEDCGLTRRETEIIKLIADGSRNSDIADILCLSPHTVKTHLYHIYKKLNVDNRMQAANWVNQKWNFFE